MASNAPQCPHCEYDLRGLPGDPAREDVICPECGKHVRAIESDVAARWRRFNYGLCASVGIPIAIPAVCLAGAFLGDYRRLLWPLCRNSLFLYLALSVLLPVIMRWYIGSFPLSRAERKRANIHMIATILFNLFVGSCLV